MGADGLLWAWAAARGYVTNPRRARARQSREAAAGRGPLPSPWFRRSPSAFLPCTANACSSRRRSQLSGTAPIAQLQAPIAQMIAHGPASSRLACACPLQPTLAWRVGSNLVGPWRRGGEPTTGKLRWELKGKATIIQRQGGERPCPMRSPAGWRHHLKEKPSMAHKDLWGLMGPSTPGQKCRSISTSSELQPPGAEGLLKPAR